jgi:putative RNA 2'-phosphotransferase
MDAARRTKVSKYLSKHLRHQPRRLGLTLEPGGWVGVDALLAACQRQCFPLTREELVEVVATNDKQRFSFDETGNRIRANQGHSTAVDLQLQLVVPPHVLYHGTAERHADAIRAEGLRKMGRHHVHLSADVPAALKVGIRHGRPLVFVIDATAMARDGHAFFRSDNGVWLVDAVPQQYLRTVS